MEIRRKKHLYACRYVARFVHIHNMYVNEINLVYTYVYNSYYTSFVLLFHLAEPKWLIYHNIFDFEYVYKQIQIIL